MASSDSTMGGELTPREREVLAMVAAGLTNREIGQALFISESTAGVHVSHIMAKLGVGSRTEAAAWAYHAGLVETAPGAMPTNGPSSDPVPSYALEPPSGWFRRLIDRLRQRDGRVAALSIGGVALLAVITVGLAIAVLNGGQPAVGDVSSASASPSASASASASNQESPTLATPGPTPIPPPNGTWSATGTMFVNRIDQTATRLRDGTVLVVGGLLNIPGDTQGSVELYDPSSGEWTTTGEMIADRMAHTATLLDDGNVLVAGGTSYHPFESVAVQNLTAAELFDPTTGSWHATTPMNLARTGHTATLLDDGTVLIVGGYGADGFGLVSAETYDPRTATWTVVAPMADGRREHTATRLKDGRVLVVGGSRSGGGASVSAAALYDPDSRTWSAAGRLATGRNGHTATLLGDGTVLVVGGHSDIGPQASAEVYRPSTNSWARVASMGESRVRATATLLQDGTLLLAGGHVDGAPAASAEVYDPANGRWAATAPMPQARALHTATMLANGEVLVSGGEWSGGGLPVVTFLYDPDGRP